MKRIWTLLLAALTLTCALSACGTAPRPAEDDPLTLLRQEIADNGSQLGVAYLGVMETSDGDMAAWLADNGWTQTFPFLSELTAAQMVTCPGDEIYCIVPADEKASLTVRAYDPLSDVSPSGDVLYESDGGAPVCLRGNVSDIMPNMEVTVSGSSGEAVYLPGLSLMDGAVSIIASTGSVYDFTPGASHDAPRIKELYSEDFDYTDGVGNSGHYTYRVPQLIASTEGAEAINRAIDQQYSPIVQEVLESVSGELSLSCLYIAWETYQYGDILSLVISCGWGFDMNEYGVYLYDTVSGRQLTTPELLQALGVDETAFLDAVRQTAAERFDGQYSAIAGDEAIAQQVAERRAWTLSDENIRTDLPTYADAAGRLHVVLSIGSIAGADAYPQVLTLDTLR